MSNIIKRTNKKLILSILSAMLGAYITFAAYFIYSQVFYNPIHPQYGGGNVFLTPRFYLSQNDMFFSVFREWNSLLVVAPIIISLICMVFLLTKIKKIPFNLYLIIVYIVGILLELLFLFITSRDGFDHVAIQIRSINNGIYAGLGQILKKFTDYGIVDLISYRSIEILYSEIYGNLKAGTYPFIGSTHPPGMFVIVGGIYSFAMKISPFASVETAIGLVVGFINSLSIVILGLIVKEAFSEKIAKLSLVIIITVPTVLIHFMSVIDGISSVFIGLGLLFIVYAVKKLLNSTQGKQYLYIFIAGYFLTLAAQFTFGHIIPICALTVSLLIIIYKQPINKLKILLFFTSFFVFPLIYVIFEYLVSDGKVFYITMALERAAFVKNGLQAREYPISQIANFIVMSVMGGLIFFPAIIQSIYSSLTFIKKLFNGFLNSNKGKKGIRNYLALCVFFMTIALLAQSTVRLEAERTWHWYFLPAWTLIGYFIYGLRATSKQLFPDVKNIEYYAYFIFLISQIVISIILGMSIMDYY
jgi:hypothetical protein